MLGRRYEKEGKTDLGEVVLSFLKNQCKY